MANQSFQGTLIIPDITGYTRFLSEVDLTHSQHIIANLLELLIDGNQLNLGLSEIEGDALLFFHSGGPIPLEEIVAQVERWIKDFHVHLNRMKRDIFCGCGACQNLGYLSLKIVCHYGEIGNFTIGNRSKLIGKDVVLAHRLLKNDLDLREYLLMTEEAYLASGGVADPGDNSGTVFQHFQEEYPIFGLTRSRFLNLAPCLENLPEHPEEWSEIPKSDGFLLSETSIHAPLESVIQALTDLEANKLWIEGMENAIYDSTEPIGAGHHHVCIIDGQNIEQTVANIRRTGDNFVMSVRIKPPIPIVKGLYRTMRLKKEGAEVRVQLYLYYTRHHLIGWLFNWLMAPKLQQGFNKSLSNLKNLLEREPNPAMSKSSVA